MFQRDVQQRIELMESELVMKSEDCHHLTETGEGEADLEVSVSNECILIRKLEKNKLEYFKNKKCADYVMFEKTHDVWIAHIFEMKKTVNEEKWENEIKQQFLGAMQNVLAFAGVLGIEIEDIVLYTVYRNDKINDMVNPARHHPWICCKNETDWNKGEILLHFLGEERFKHNKIALDIESGKGKYCLGK